MCQYSVIPTRAISSKTHYGQGLPETLQCFSACEISIGLEINQDYREWKQQGSVYREPTGSRPIHRT